MSEQPDEGHVPGPAADDSGVDGVCPNRLDLPSASDGWRAGSHTSDDEISVWIEIKYNGEVQQEHSCKVWSSDTQTAADVGQQILHQELWDALCRYMNCGGQLCDVYEQVAGIQYLPEVDVPGYSLLATDSSGEYPEHIFICDAAPEKALYWQEDITFEQISINELGEYIFDEDEDIFDSEGPEAEGEAHDQRSGPTFIE